MSGDVQPRKRKDKKRKKDELGVEEHRGTAAVFGEGDVMMHSQQDHGTGGHWCAKIIFFSLLAVLVTLIGLIILENRGLTELEANQVETQYSGILDGWIEDVSEDDHHDEHTLELKHHRHDDEDVGDDEHELENDEDEDFENQDDDEPKDEIDYDVVDDTEEDGHNEESDDLNDDENDDDEDYVSKEADEDNDEDNMHSVDKQNDDDDSNEDDDNEIIAAKFAQLEEYADDVNEEDDDGNHIHKSTEDTDDRNDDDDDDINDSQINDDDDDDNDEENIHSVENYYYENDDDNYQKNQEAQDDEDNEEHEEDHEDEMEGEVEKIEKEVSDEDEPISAEVPLADVSVEKDVASVEVAFSDELDEADGQDYLEADELDEPAVERIAPPPPGQPYAEIEEEVSAEIHRDTLAEEEEYERQQEQLRQEEEQSSSHMWLKLAVGGALLVATHAVVRRATAPRDTPESEREEHASRDETPLSDRRMTLIPDEKHKVVQPQSIQTNVEEEISQRVSSFVKASPVPKQESEEVEDDVALDEYEDQEVPATKNSKNKELFSDEDENEADEEVEEEEEVKEKEKLPKAVAKVSTVKKEEESEPEEVPDDVEIIDDDQIEEEIEEEVEEEEISDVDDAELLNRLEAKYGRLPEPERPAPRQKDGGNSIEDEWPGEPSDAFWRDQLQQADQDLRQGSFGACEKRASAAELAGSARALWLRARALDSLAEARRDNRVLGRAIAAYLQLLKMNERLSDKKLLEIALRTVDRIQFRGTYLNAEPVYRLLIRRFPNDVTFRNNLTISFLMANRADLASEVLKETLKLWPNDRVALAHYGFVLKTKENKLEEAVTYFQKALDGDAGPANDPRFYYHLGDALLMLGRQKEAQDVHERGAALGHFLSPVQRSLYNVPHLKSQPWWDVERTPYAKLAHRLENSWREILKEAEAARELYEKEKEGLRERGEWSQLDVFVRGREVAGRCARAPVTCAIVRDEPAAQCRRGQVKFSALSGGTHVRAHVGPTNCRLRMHLALANTQHTYIRVDQETRQWQVGKVLMFDDSFEHEVWHNGSDTRLVLIVDVWHPDLTPLERRTLPPI